MWTDVKKGNPRGKKKRVQINSVPTFKADVNLHYGTGSQRDCRLYKDKVFMWKNIPVDHVFLEDDWFLPCDHHRVLFASFSFAAFPHS